MAKKIDKKEDAQEYVDESPAQITDDEEAKLMVKLEQLQRRKAIEDFQLNAPAKVAALNLRVAELEKAMVENRNAIIELRKQMQLLIRGK